VIEFRIYATNKGDLQPAKKDLIERIADMVDDFTIKDEVIKLLDDSAVDSIIALHRADVTIDIGKSNMLRDC